MVASMELNDKLQKISALMGLLRSDLLELSAAGDTAQRAPVVEHVNWIADQLDAMGATLSEPGDNRATTTPSEASHSDTGQRQDKPAAHKDRTSESARHAPYRSEPGPGHAPQKDRHAKAGDAEKSTSAASGMPPLPADPRHPDDGSAGQPRPDEAKPGAPGVAKRSEDDTSH